MTKRNMTDWNELGVELAMTSRLLGAIVCDPRYQSMLPKSVLGPLITAQRNVDRVRSNSEDRMLREEPNGGTDIFYPSNRLPMDSMIEDVRNIARNNTPMNKED